MSRQSDEDEGLQTDPEGPGVEIGTISSDDAPIMEATDPFQTGGGRQTHRGGQLLIGDPTILLQSGQNGVIDSVHGDKTPLFPQLIRVQSSYPNYILRYS
jgi:hypothetical protein